MESDRKVIIETISNYLSQFSKEDSINLDWLQRVLRANVTTPIPKPFLISYLKEKGYNHIQTKTKRKEVVNHQVKSTTEGHVKTEKPAKENKRVTRSVVLDDDDDDDFDPNEFLQANKEKISNIEVPTKSYEENIGLIESYQKDNRSELLAEIVRKNMGLVEKIANRYQKAQRHDLSYDDLVSVGKFGLIKAIDRFDTTKGYQFSTYATWWIRQKITRAIMDEGTTIRVPVHMHEQINKLIRTENESVLVNGELNIDWVCERLDITKERYHELKLIDQSFLGMASLHSVVSTEDEDSLLIDFIAYTGTNVLGAEIAQFLDPYEQTVYRNLQDKLEEILSTLTEREQKIILCRFGFDDGKIYTLEEVGKMFGVTRERIRQIEEKALRKIRARLARRRLKYADLTVEGF